MTVTSMPRKSDRWIPWYFVLFFVVLTVVLGDMVYTAINGFQGVVTEHAYDKGLSYNKTLEAARQQKALGWSDKITLSPVENKLGIVFSLRDAQGSVISGADVTAWVVRPTHKGMDYKVAMKENADRSYAAEQILPARGLWEVRISALSQGQNYQAVQRIELP